jgi:hypothetical protein
MSLSEFYSNPRAFGAAPFVKGEFGLRFCCRGVTGQGE